MIYRVTLEGSGQIAEVSYSGPMIAIGDRLPLMVKGRESLYIVTEVRRLPRLEQETLAVDLMVRKWLTEDQ